MEPERPKDPQKPGGPQPFISQEQRPDLTIDLNRKVGDLTVRDLQTLLGSGASPKLKELAKEKEDLLDKIPTKDTTKDPKDRKDIKDHKEPKDHKDQKDQKDHKDPKDPKDQKDTKDPKDTKDQKDQKDHKDPKDPKEQKDNKDHKDPKEHKDTKDHKDHKDIKEGALDKVPHKDQLEKLPESPVKANEGSPNSGSTPGGLEDLIQRVSGLEKEVQELKGAGRAPGR
jgi:hypothetical protein